ncbi:PH domain-containing protein [Roseomonas sp. CCTCC AB2023176]|uniref:PH domain-containing protein n=1 Tax=Roseomonas sp. CCTCC AB2023176 TaxID=3342640 RepID=UPI0035DDFFB1
MGLFNAILGNASTVEAEKVSEEFAPLLIPGEVVTGAYRLVRDMFVFTTKRLMVVDRQGVTGRKTEYLSIPYADVSRFSVETAGHFDLESDIKIWLRGHAEPMRFTVPRGGAILEVQRLLAAGVLAE